ncbi:MAG: hypothetical protein KC416_16855, partial [Myxococcales bacterium]|nr:hypothetical protein [Myxococcales bacterium]
MNRTFTTIGVVMAVLLNGCASNGAANKKMAFDGGQGTDDGASGERADAAEPFCLEADKYIYLLKHSWVVKPEPPNQGVSRADLVRFDPGEKELKVLGQVECVGAEGPSTMAIDRSARAWIYFRSGHLGRVDLTDPSLPCELTGFDPDVDGFPIHGMAFSAKSEKSPIDVLYVATHGGDGTSFGGPTLARLDTTTMDLSVIGALAQFGELTGNGLGQLWVFSASQPPRNVYQVDPSDGTVLRTFDAQSIDFPQSGASGYAFAHWGGRYYLIYRSAAAFTMDETSTMGIWMLDPGTGQIDVVIEETGHDLVGAGVSTCAP